MYNAADEELMAYVRREVATGKKTISIPGHLLQHTTEAGSRPPERAVGGGNARSSRLAKLLLSGIYFVKSHLSVLQALLVSLAILVCPLHAEFLGSGSDFPSLL